MRSTEAQLLEAELMNSTPEHVYAWLKRRAEASNGESYSGDEELEEAPLSRESDLVDLGLARYGFSGAVVRKLFSGDRRHSQGDAHILGRSDHAMLNMTRVLRLAVLSNRMLTKHTLLERMPHILFGINWLSSDLEPIREFVTSAGADEIIALFHNPTIDDDVLAKLYKKERPFDSLSEERWQHLILASVGNPRLRAEYVGPMDGWAEYRHGCVFNEACALAEKVPTTKRWAEILVLLLQETSPEAFAIKDKMAVIQRWHVSASGEADAEPAEDSSSEDGYLDDFAAVRLVLVRLLSNSEIHGLRSHEDVAMRCAFYRYGNPTPEELREAHAREPKFLLNYALRNDAIWRRSETREVLRELCWADKSDHDLWFPNAYRDRSDRLKSEHPEWFQEE